LNGCDRPVLDEDNAIIEDALVLIHGYHSAAHGEGPASAGIDWADH
jgi:hypothetical protein